MAEIGNKFGLGGGGGQFNGSRTFIMMPGKYFHPPHLRPAVNTSTRATTGARYYIVPWSFEQTTVLAGAWCWNAGTGDSGDKFKMALYSEKTTGGPGAVAKNFGEATFGATAVVNALASSVTVTPGRYYLEFVTDNAVTMYTMTSLESASNAGYVLPAYAANTMGTLGAPLNSSSLQNLQVSGDYVAGTYANFPEANSLTPTASLAGADQMPFFGIYT